MLRDAQSLTSWHADWSGLRVAVLGLGATGFSAADTLIELGAVVLVVAESAAEDQADLSEVIGAEVVLDASRDVPAAFETFGAELVIVSPGFASDHPWPGWAISQGIPVWGDLELAWRLRDKVGEPAEWIVLTGRDSAVRASALATHLLISAGQRVATAGENGIPVLDVVRDPIGFAAIVLAVSPERLRWVPTAGVGALAPAASACLTAAGAAPDTLEALGTVYANTRIACLYNTADEATMHLVEEADVQDGCRAVGFGRGAPGPSDVGMVDDLLVDRAFHDDRRHSALELTTHGELERVGLNTPEGQRDALAAAAVARLCGVAPEIVRDGFATFVQA